MSRTKRVTDSILNGSSVRSAIFEGLYKTKATVNKKLDRYTSEWKKQLNDSVEGLLHSFDFTQMEKLTGKPVNKDNIISKYGKYILDPIDDSYGWEASGSSFKLEFWSPFDNPNFVNDCCNFVALNKCFIQLETQYGPDFYDRYESTYVVEFPITTEKLKDCLKKHIANGKSDTSSADSLRDKLSDQFEMEAASLPPEQQFGLIPDDKALQRRSEKEKALQTRAFVEQVTQLAKMYFSLFGQHSDGGFSCYLHRDPKRFTDGDIMYSFYGDIKEGDNYLGRLFYYSGVEDSNYGRHPSGRGSAEATFDFNLNDPQDAAKKLLKAVKEVDDLSVVYKDQAEKAEAEKAARERKDIDTLSFDLKDLIWKAADRIKKIRKVYDADWDLFADGTLEFGLYYDRDTINFQGGGEDDVQIHGTVKVAPEDIDNEAAWKKAINASKRDWDVMVGP